MCCMSCGKQPRRSKTLNGMWIGSRQGCAAGGGGVGVSRSQYFQICKKVRQKVNHAAGELATVFSMAFVF